jgi:glycosyltransferase involved in cell wall biosynthesis
MVANPDNVEVSVIVPARNEEASLGACLASLVGQATTRARPEIAGDLGQKDLHNQHKVVWGTGTGGLERSSPHPFPKYGKGWGTHSFSGVPSFEVIVVDDSSTDGTRAIAESFASVRVVSAGSLPEGWSGKCNACWSGAKVAKGKWLLFTDADTKHADNSIEQGLREAEDCGAAMLSYSPKQEVHGFWERALMPVIFAELAKTYRPREVSDPNSPAAAANGQYLLIRRDVYDNVGGHAAVAHAILEDVELAKLVKGAGYKLQFRVSDAVNTRMYRSLGQMWEGWTKNLALLFPRPLWLAAKRSVEFLLIVASVVGAAVAVADGDWIGVAINGAIAVTLGAMFFRRIRRAHFDAISNCIAVFGLPLFGVLLVNSYISHKSGTVRWKGRIYRADAQTEERAANGQ